MFKKISTVERKKHCKIILNQSISLCVIQKIYYAIKYSDILI